MPTGHDRPTPAINPSLLLTVFISGRTKEGAMDAIAELAGHPRCCENALSAAIAAAIARGHLQPLQSEGYELTAAGLAWLKKHPWSSSR